MGTRKNHLGEAVLTSTHNLCFGAKIRKIGIKDNKNRYTGIFIGIFICGTVIMLKCLHVK